MTPPARTMCAFQRPPKDGSGLALRGQTLLLGAETGPSDFREREQRSSDGKLWS
jgi:hypothetical protein